MPAEDAQPHRAFSSPLFGACRVFFHCVPACLCSAYWAQAHLAFWGSWQAGLLSRAKQLLRPCPERQWRAEGIRGCTVAPDPSSGLQSSFSSTKADSLHPDVQILCVTFNCLGIYVRVCPVAQLCLTLCDPWTVAYQALLSMEFSRQEYWSGLPFPPPGHLPNPRIEPTSLISPALIGGFLTTEPPGKPMVIWERDKLERWLE